MNKTINFIRRIGHKIANLQAIVLLSLIYVIILPIFALISKLTSERSKKGWVKWKLKSEKIEDLRNQF